MPALFAAAAIALAAAVLRRRQDADLGVESVVLAGAGWLTLLGLTAVLLAELRWFDATSMTLATATEALVVWPWGAGRWRPRLDAGSLAAGLVVVTAGLALRGPTADYALAGRDQGTYTLRAQLTLRTGAIDFVDPVLAHASAEVDDRPGPADVLGLYPIRGDGWARDRYEGAYRPGLYLADRKRGRVTPQFFHLLPMWLATAGLVVGPQHVGVAIPIMAALSLLAVWAVARRLWPSGPWAWLATGLVVASPLAIWVQRTALTEVPATMLTWTAVLAVLRDTPRDRGLAAVLLGAGAWLRGHGLLVAPVIAVALWLVPPGPRRWRRAGLVYLCVVVAGVLVHAPTTWPYLHDELARQLPGELHPSPPLMIAAAVAATLTWWGIDEVWAARRRRATAPTRAPLVLALALLAAVVAWWWGRGATPTKPFARLDAMVPLLGPVWLGTAAIGIAVTARRRLQARPRDVWLVAIAAGMVATIGLYAQRNLPQLGLYYYGRYLAPEVLVAAALAATAGVVAVHRAIRNGGRNADRGREPRRRVVAAGVATGHATLLAWSVVGVLFTHPVTRIAEFAGASRMLDHVAAKLPTGAIVIAGGEGWHHGHTFNQVGGALALRYGVTVLPYRTREAAYATLHELLVARPAATGRPAPPVFVLLNEATKPYRRPDEPDRGPIAGLDDLLWAPFVATRIDLVELYVDRLTPVDDAIPTRVTRDGLRMGLLRIDVDPDAEVERYDPRDATRVTVRGATGAAGPMCLRERARIELDLPATGDAGDGPVSLVLVAEPGTSAHNFRWTIEVDGERVATTLPRARDRARDTLGPFVLARRPRTIALVGSPKRRKAATCPRGGLAEIRLLPPERGQLHRAPVPVEALTFAPARDLGHPIQPVSWVSGRGLSRFRSGTRPTPQIRGLSMVLPADTPLTLAPQALPDEGRDELDVVVTLSASHAGPDASLRLQVGDVQVVADPVPPELDRSWQSPFATIRPSSPVAEVRLQLRAAESSAHVDVRDIGLFSRATPIEGRRADGPLVSSRRMSPPEEHRSERDR